MKKNYKYYVYAPLNEKRWVELRKKENRQEFENALKQLSNIANKRIAKLEKTEWGKRSPAYKKWEEHGLGLFGKGDYSNYNDIVKEYSRVSAFLRLKTTTEPAFNKFKGHVEDLFGYEFKSPEDYDVFWDSFTRFTEMNEAFEKYIYRGTAISELADIFVQKNVETKEEGAELLNNWFHNFIGDAQDAYQGIEDVQKIGQKYSEYWEDDDGFTF